MSTYNSSKGVKAKGHLWDVPLLGQVNCLKDLLLRDAILLDCLLESKLKSKTKHMIVYIFKHIALKTKIFHYILSNHCILLYYYRYTLSNHTFGLHTSHIIAVININEVFIDKSNN
jgi:hypothetical protein